MSEQPRSNDGDESYIVKPVHKALSLLQVIGKAQGVSIVEASELSGLPKSTTFKYLRTFVNAGFATYDGTRHRYQLGPQVYLLAQRGDTTRALRSAARPIMRDLRERFNETVNLGVLDGTDIVYVAIDRSTHSLRLEAVLEGHYPAYTTGLGKAILAYLPEPEVRTHLPARLEPKTARTITSLADMHVELATVRDRGYAIDNGEGSDQVTCAAVPIRDANGDVVGAMSVAGPSFRMEPMLQDVAEELQRSAALVTADLRLSAEA